jgi:hypothetical protein
VLSSLVETTGIDTGTRVGFGDVVVDAGLVYGGLGSSTFSFVHTGIISKLAGASDRGA